MAKTVFSDALIAFDGYALHDTTNQCAVDYSAEELDGTTFGDDTRIMEAGLLTCSMGAQGFFRGTPDDGLFTNIGASDKVVTIAPSDAEGSIAYSLNAVLGEYSPSGSVGDLLGFSMSAGARDKLLRGTLLANKSGITATGSGTAFQVGAATADQTLFAALHIIGAEGTSPTLDLIIESDDAEALSDPTTRITFDQATAIGSQYKSLAGAVTDTWWRASYTIGGTSPDIDFIVVLGVLNNR